MSSYKFQVTSLD